MSDKRFPLAWPMGWKRTTFRKAASFHGTRRQSSSDGTGYWLRKEPLTLSQALDRLSGEMRRLGVSDSNWLLSSNLRTRLDGLPYASQAMPTDPGVAIYFKLKGQQRVLACDLWQRLPDNIAAIAAHIECIRGIDRYGVGTLDQAFAGYAALPAKGSTWRTTLGFAPDATVTPDDIHEAFRARAMTAHPDVEGGSHDAMASLNEARREGLESVRLGVGQ